MANRFNRSVRNVRDIEKFPFFTNEINDLIHTVDDKTYIRLNRKYERITGLEELEKTFYGFKKQIERKTDNTNKKLNDYMKNNDEVIYNLTKEHGDRLLKLENAQASNSEDLEETFVTREEFEEFQININNRVNEMFAQIQKDMAELRGEDVEEDN